MPKVLLIDDDDDHASRLDCVLTERRCIVTRAADCGLAVAMLRTHATMYDLVILSMAGRSRPWLTVLRKLQESGGRAGFLEGPQFICVSRLHLGIDLQLRIEGMGARYASEE